MKIIHRSPDALVVRDAQPVLRGMGIGMCAFAGWVWWLGYLDAAGDGLATVPAAVSLVLATLGVLLVVLPVRSTFAFDVRARVLVTTRRSFHRPAARTEIAFRDIAAVEVQRSTDGEGGKMYRLVTRLTNGATVPWTSYLTSFGERTMREVSAAVTEMLKHPAGTVPARLPAPERAAPVRKSGAAVKLFALFCVPFLALGSYTVWLEQNSLTTYQPVTALVTDSRVDLRSDSEGSSYAPVVTYRYEVSGRGYVSSRATPLSESGRRRWAERIAARFEPGQQYVAYYDPQRPERAFLVRERSAVPWAFVALPLLALLALGAVERKQGPT